MKQPVRVNRADRGRFQNSCWPVAALLGLLAWSAGTWAALPAWAQSPIANRSIANSAVPAASGRLQTLVRETAAQFQIAYRHNAAEQSRRREQLAAAVAAWRGAARGEASDRLLSEWLRAAIRKSMPGSREPLPPLPKFARPPVAAPAATTASPSTSTTRKKPVVDNPGASQAKLPSGQPSAERSMIGGSAAGPAEAATSSSTVGADDNRKSEQDFWSAHPANGDLPAELSGGDPFRDDPPPAAE